MKNNIPEFNATIGKEFDAKAVKLKKQHSYLTSTYITSLFLGAFFIDLGLKENLPLFLGFIFTGIALFIYAYRWNKKSNEQWTYSRVVAESIKSEWFKYITGGGDYPCNETIGEEYYADLLEKNIKEKVDEYRSSLLSISKKPIEFSFQIDSLTRNLRSMSFLDRLERYKKERIEDQKNWYENKARIMANKDKMLKISFVVIVVAGLIVGVTKLFNLEYSGSILVNESDWFSITIALAFAVENLNSIFQYERLGINYKKSAQDLRESLRKIDDKDNDVRSNENVFSEFVEDVENRISNEHKSWSLTTSSKNLPNFI